MHTPPTEFKSQEASLKFERTRSTRSKNEYGCYRTILYWERRYFQLHNFMRIAFHTVVQWHGLQAKRLPTLSLHYERNWDSRSKKIWDRITGGSFVYPIIFIHPGWDEEDQEATVLHELAHCTVNMLIRRYVRKHFESLKQRELEENPYLKASRDTFTYWNSFLYERIVGKKLGTGVINKHKGPWKAIARNLLEWYNVPNDIKKEHLEHNYGES